MAQRFVMGYKLKEQRLVINAQKLKKTTAEGPMIIQEISKYLAEILKMGTPDFVACFPAEI